MEKLVSLILLVLVQMKVSTLISCILHNHDISYVLNVCTGMYVCMYVCMYVICMYVLISFRYLTIT